MIRLPQHIQDKIAPCPNSGCWLWLAWDDGKKDPYGKCRWRGVAWMAHRLVYTLLRGTIPEGKVLDHLCRVRLCVNPEHLEPVTQRENTHRGEAILYETNTN